MSQGYYLSIDIEADGPIPSVYSMLSIGAALFTKEGEFVSSFSRNMKDLPGAIQDPDTMQFWRDNPDAYAASQTDRVLPAEAMYDFRDWIDMYVPQDAWVTLVGYPITYDFMWVYWYYWRFVEAMPRFSFSGLDMKTYAAATLKSQYKFATKRNWPSKWKTVEQVHTHVAEQDAIEQGHMFFAMQQDNTAKYDIEIQRVAGGPTMFINTRPIVVEDDDPSYDTISARKFITLMQRIGFFGESKGHRLQVSDVARLIKKLGNRVTLR